jgi:hypothetical protein
MKYFVAGSRRLNIGWQRQEHFEFHAFVIWVQDSVYSVTCCYAVKMTGDDRYETTRDDCVRNMRGLHHAPRGSNLVSKSSSNQDWGVLVSKSLSSWGWWLPSTHRGRKILFAPPVSLALLCVLPSIANQLVSVSSTVGHQISFVLGWLDSNNYKDGNNCTDIHLAGSSSSIVSWYDNERYILSYAWFGLS